MAKKKGASQRVVAYQNFFNTESGKIVLLDMMRTHYITGSLFSENPQVLALREGERNVVLRILHLLNVSDLQIREMMKEEGNE